MPQSTGDRLDRRILELIQEDARISNADLAAKVGLSPSPCWRRVKALEERGVIRSYVTLVAPEAIGLPVNVWVHVTLNEQVERRLEHFEEAGCRDATAHPHDTVVGLENERPIPRYADGLKGATLLLPIFHVGGGDNAEPRYGGIGLTQTDEAIRFGQR